MSASQACHAGQGAKVRGLQKSMVRHGLPEPEAEVKFHPWRGWKLDLGDRDYMVAVEYDGGTWQGLPSHASGRGIRRDAEKLAEAQIHGWIVVRVTADMYRDGTGMRLILDAYRARGWDG